MSPNTTPIVANAVLTMDRAASGDKAGLVAFQNEEHYYFLGVARRGNETVIELEVHNGKTTPDTGSVLASVPIGVSASKPIYLKIEAREGRYDFYYGSRPNQWTALLRDAGSHIRVVFAEHAGERRDA